MTWMSSYDGGPMPFKVRTSGAAGSKTLVGLNLSTSSWEPSDNHQSQGISPEPETTVVTLERGHLSRAKMVN